MSDSDTRDRRGFKPFGYPFDIQSTMSVKEAKLALRKQKQGWFKPKTGPRGWILGSLLCLQLSSIGQQGPVVLALITEDGFGSRVKGRAGPDMAILGLIVAGLAFPIYDLFVPVENRISILLLFAAVYIPFSLGIIWLRSRFSENAEPLVRFIRRVLEAPKAHTVKATQSQFDRTPISSARLTVDGDDIGCPPSEHDVSEAILAMEPGGFLIVELGVGTFMQAALEYDRFVLEKCEGSVRELYRAKGNFEGEEIVAVMTAYLRGSEPSGQLIWEKTRG